MKWLAASWLALMGIAPLSWPAHSWDATWFPLDLVLHGVGGVWIFYLTKAWLKSIDPAWRSEFRSPKYRPSVKSDDE
jgi:hypothetical protein